MTPRTLTKLKKSNKILGSLIKKAGPVKIKPQPMQSPFEALVEAVVFQQLSGKAAQTILNRVLALFPKKDFPSPEDLLKISLDELRSAGLSRAKASFVQDIARKTLEGIVPTSDEIEKLTDDEIIHRLTQIHGVGAWTVQMMLIFKLRRPDVWPVNDYGVRKGFALAYKKKDLPTPKELEKFGEQFRPHRTSVAWYMWRSVDIHKEAVSKKKPSKKK